MPNFAYLSKYWDIYKYPWRPNDLFLEIIDKNIGNKKNIKILILWSTQEFRYKYQNHIITLCDVSNEMVISNDVWNRNEIIWNKDWFELEKWNFDLILWDLVLLMFEFEQKKILIEQLLKNIHGSGGIILRCVVKKNNIFIKDITHILTKIHSYSSINDFFNYISFELVNWFWFSWHNIYNILCTYSKKLGNIFKDTFLKFTPYNNSKKYCLSSQQLIFILNHYDGKILSKISHLCIEEFIIYIKKI